MKSKKILIILTIIIILFIVGYVIHDNDKVNEKNGEDTTISTDIKKKEKKFDMTEAGRSEITNIFSHLGFYYDVNKDEKDDIWGITLKNLVVELSKYKDENKFANLLLNEIEKTNYKNWNKFEQDFFDALMKQIFVDVNTLPTATNNYLLNDILNIEEATSIDKIYLQNYDDSFNTENSKYQRFAYFHFDKVNVWIRVHSWDSEEGGDNQFCDFPFNNLKIPDEVKPTVVDPDILKDFIKENYDLISLLFQYRNNVFWPIKQQSRTDREKAAEAAKVKDYIPTVGMTKNQVLSSKWGSPKDKNITETRYGTHEQWVYGNGRYVYFDDGIVTSVQRSE